jgi:adenylate cyclase
MDKLKALLKRYFQSISTGVRAAVSLLLVFAFTLTYVPLKQNELFNRLELQAYDIRLRLTMPRTTDSRIVIIDLDEKSIQAEGRWPWGRDKISLLTRKLFEKQKVKAAGFDVFFTEADTSSGLSKLEALAQTTFKDNEDFQNKMPTLRKELDYDGLFEQDLKKHLVVLAFSGQSNQVGQDELKLGGLPPPSWEPVTVGTLNGTKITGYSGVLPRFLPHASAVGHALPFLDIDGAVRRVPAYVEFNGKYYDSLSIALTRTYLNNEPSAVKFIDDKAENKILESVTINKKAISVDQDGMFLIPFRGPTPAFKYISATDIMRDKLPEGSLEGKLALVGTSAQGLLDLRLTPVGENYPGVETHANMLSGYLSGTIKSEPTHYKVVIIFIMLTIGILFALALVRLSALWGTVTMLASALVLIGINMLYWNAGTVLPIAVPLLMLGTIYFFNMAYGYFVEAANRKKITDVFGTYIPKELAAEVAKDPGAYNVSGETRDMTVLFSDVRGFTTISEGLSAKDLTALMNSYLTHMTEDIQSHRGTIDKYIGDAIMAFWGAPLKDERHAYNAMMSALDMQAKVKAIAPEFKKNNWPPVEIGIGLNCGLMNVGDMGSSFRRAYTVMGDAVNLAARLESLTKEYGVGILVSEHIVKAVPEVVYCEMDRVRVKGKLEPITIYEPIGKKGALSDAQLDDIEAFHKALGYFVKQKFDETAEILQRLKAANPNRKVYDLYEERIAYYRENPPGENWDGVYTFTKK